MSAENIILAVLAVATYQLYVTLRVLFSSQYTARQRIAQTAIIWLVPLFGAIACHSFVASDMRKPRPRDTAFSEAGESPTGVGQDGHGQ